jgi:hypothetical protein
MKNSTLFRKISYWYLLGMLAYLATFLSSVWRSLPSLGFFDFITMIFDWASGCIIYFFIGAMIGFIVDLIIARFAKRRIIIPLWLWLTGVFWITSSIAAAVFTQRADVSWVLVVLFPVAYGVFFMSYAYALLVPNSIEYLTYTKFIWNIIITAAFVCWLFVQHKTSWRTISRIILITLFVLLFVGMAGCVSMLA